MNALLVTPSTISYLFSMDASGSRDAEATCSQFMEIISRAEEEFGPHCFALVTDTPSVNRAAVELLRIRRPKIIWVPCLAHCLNLFFKDLVIFPKIGQMWDKVKTVVNLFRSRSVPRDLLRQELKDNEYPSKRRSQPLKGVVPACELRFGNIYNVISRLIRIEERLKFVTVSNAFSEWIARLPKKSDRLNGRDVQTHLLPTSPLWTQMKEFHNLLTPVYCWLREVDSNACVAGKVYKRMSDIEDHMKGCNTSWLTKEDLCAFQKAWIERWNYSHCDLYSAGKLGMILKSAHFFIY